LVGRSAWTAPDGLVRQSLGMALRHIVVWRHAPPLEMSKLQRRTASSGKKAGPAAGTGQG